MYVQVMVADNQALMHILRRRALAEVLMKLCFQLTWRIFSILAFEWHRKAIGMSVCIEMLVKPIHFTRTLCKHLHLLLLLIITVLPDRVHERPLTTVSYKLHQHRA